MPSLKLPSDSVIWEGPYSAVESTDRLRVFHAYQLSAKYDERKDTHSLCGRWHAQLGQVPPRFRRRWGDGPAGMYADQRWCEDCRIKVQSIRTRLDAEAVHAFANQRAGKGRRKKPEAPPARDSFEHQHRTQAELWVRATDFPFLSPDAVPVDANIDVEWRCTVRGHPNYVDQPKHVHELLIAKRKVCPLCREGLRPEPWTKNRIVAFVRSMGDYLDQLSPADRYQLLLQTGLLNSGGAWAAPVSEAILHGSAKASHAALSELVDDLEPETHANALYKRLRKHTIWTDDAHEKRSLKGNIRERFEYWCSVVAHENKLEAIRCVCAPQIQRHLDTLWRYAPSLEDSQPDYLRRILLDLFPKRGLRREFIVASPPEEELGRVESLLWTLSAYALNRNEERDAALIALRDEIALASQARGDWLQTQANRPEHERAPMPIRKAEISARLLRELLSTHHRKTTIEHLRQMCGPDARDEETVVLLWRVAPTVGALVDGEDEFRRLMREALPEIVFVPEAVAPAAPVSEALESWKQRTFGEIGAKDVEASDSAPSESTSAEEALPSDRVAQILDVSDRLLFADYDIEAVDYFLSSQVAKLWSIAFEHAGEALSAAKKWQGSDFGNQVRDLFLQQVHDTEHLVIPDDWDFRPPGVSASVPPFPPRLMQRLTAVRLRDATSRGIGNWSLMGGGKTVSAVLSAAVIDSKLTVVICPNATVDGWRDEILRVFPAAKVSIGWEPPANAKRRFVVLNVEQFQLADTETRIRRLLDREPPQLVVLDEVHKFKQRDKALTRRREMMLAFLSTSAEQYPDLKVLGLSGTPVINNLMEARSLIELVTLTRHSDLEVTPTLPNAMRVHSRLARLGLRYRPDYLAAFEGIRKVRIDVSHRLQHLRSAADRHAAETLLMHEKLAIIAGEAKPRTVIYSELVTDIHTQIASAVTAKGLSIGYFNGDDKSGLSNFKARKVDVLIASNALGTGVDGLQHSTDRLIVATLPWTSSDFDQLLGRFFRPRSDGSVGHAEVVVPWTFLPATSSRTGQEWSMDEARWRRIQYKSSLADTAIDGVLPEGELRTPEQAFKDLQTWLMRLEAGTLTEPRREPLHVPLGESARKTVTARVGDLTRFHARVASSRAETTHALLQEDPDQWAWYHTEVEEAASSWPFRPVDRCIDWLRRRAERRKGLVVVDLGCGLAKVHAALHELCEVRSFDHVAYNANVTVANVAAAVPIDDAAVDAVVLSLMLDWQKDWERCLDEAARILALDGQLLLWETRSFVERIGGADTLNKLLHTRGLRVVEVFDEKFFGVVAIKT
jgi:superfamily II DNA or RNA helicase